MRYAARHERDGQRQRTDLRRAATPSCRSSIMASSTARGSTRRCAPTTGSRFCSIGTCGGCGRPPACCRCRFRLPIANRRPVCRDGCAAGLGTGGREAYIRILVTRGVGELSYDPAVCPDADGRGHRQAADRSAAGGLRARRGRFARLRSSGITPRSVNPLIKSNNLLNNALAMQEAVRRGAFEGVMRNYRGELAECTHRQPFRRQERRGADPAARRGPARRHHAGIPVRGRG